MSPSASPSSMPVTGVSRQQIQAAKQVRGRRQVLAAAAALPAPSPAAHPRLPPRPGAGSHVPERRGGAGCAGGRGAGAAGLGGAPARSLPRSQLLPGALVPCTRRLARACCRRCRRVLPATDGWRSNAARPHPRFYALPSSHSPQEPMGAAEEDVEAALEALLGEVGRTVCRCAQHPPTVTGCRGAPCPPALPPFPLPTPTATCPPIPIFRPAGRGRACCCR